MTTRVRVLRVVGIALVATCLALASGVVGPVLGNGPAPAADRATDPIPSTEPGQHAGSTAPVESFPSWVDTGQVNDRPVPTIVAGGQADLITHERSGHSARPSRQGALPAPFAQADDDDGDSGDDSDDGDGAEDDEETHVINITAPDEEIEYTLTAPGLEPASDVDLVDGDGNESNQDVIRGDTATGFIGNGNYDAYRFTGSVDRVRLDSNRIDDLEVTIDGEPVDPRTLTGEETETTATGTGTGTDTAAETATQSTGTSAAPTTATGTGTADTATDSSPTTASGPATTTASGGQSGRSGFGMVMFVLIGIVSGLVLAGALVYAVRSDRSG